MLLSCDKKENETTLECVFSQQYLHLLQSANILKFNLTQLFAQHLNQKWTYKYN